MAKEMLINVSEGEECRIALLNDGRLEELYMERTSATSHVGNIYKGRVTNVEPSIQAAFVDFGLGRNGFLHISDLMPTYFGRGGGDIVETVGKKMARRDRPPIQRCLRRGDEIIVQIIKEGIGTKGPTLSTYLSIPGRILVMMPGMGKMGVSKKIEDEVERKRLRQILDSLKPPKDVGFIIRTAGIGKTKTEIQRDLTYLSRLWATLEKKRKEPAPVELYTEGDLVTRTVRDVFSTDVDRIIVDNKEVAKRVKEVIKITNPRTKNRVDLFDEPVPLFHQYGIEREIEQMYSRHVPLPSGGSLVIDSTEAIVAIDVNSGKFRDHADAETTAFKTDMEAADEIPRQLKLRDLGGVIICDFIDLRYERHRRELEQRLHDNFKRDRAKTKVLRMSQFGIIELTRQRMRPSLKRSIYFDCPHCKGAGLVKTPESMSLDVMRRLAIAAADLKVARVELSVCPDVSFYLLNKKRAQLAKLESETNKRIAIRTEQGLGLDEMRLELFDARDGMVILEELGMTMAQPPHTTQLGTRPAGGRRGGRFDDRRPASRPDGRGGRGGRGQGKRPDPAAEAVDPRADLDDAEEAIEELEDRRERGLASAADMGLLPTLAEDEPAAPAPVSGRADIDDDEHEDEEAGEGATDIDEGPDHTMGERPEGEFDRPGRSRDGGGGQQRGGRRRRRGRRGRGGQGGGAQAGGAQSPRQQGQPDQPAGGGGRQPQPPGGGQRRDRSEPVGPAPEPFEEHDEVAPRGNRALPVQPESEPDDEPTPGNHREPAPRDDQPQGEAGPRKRRRRRGGRGRRGRGRGKNDADAQANGGEQAAGESSMDDHSDAADNGDVEDAQRAVAPARREVRQSPRAQSSASRRVVVADEQPVVKTGSADKHLVMDGDDVDEEPIVPTSVPRPRSYTDLDAIPDDYE